MHAIYMYVSYSATSKNTPKIIYYFSWSTTVVLNSLRFTHRQLRIIMSSLYVS